VFKCVFSRILSTDFRLFYKKRHVFHSFTTIRTLRCRVFFAIPDESVDRRGENGVEFDQVFDLLAGMHDGRMVATVELRTDLRGGVVGRLADDVHGDLTGKGDIFVALLAF